MVIAVAAYLLGSIPTGYLVARARGIDIRTVGSGNIGAANVFRMLGKPAGILGSWWTDSRVMPRVHGWRILSFNRSPWLRIKSNV